MKDYQSCSWMCFHKLQCLSNAAKKNLVTSSNHLSSLNSHVFKSGSTLHTLITSPFNVKDKLSFLHILQLQAPLITKTPKTNVKNFLNHIFFKVNIQNNYMVTFIDMEQMIKLLTIG